MQPKSQARTSASSTDMFIGTNIDFSKLTFKPVARLKEFCSSFGFESWVEHPSKIMSVSSA